MALALKTLPAPRPEPLQPPAPPAAVEEVAASPPVYPGDRWALHFWIACALFLAFLNVWGLVAKLFQ